MHINAAFQSAIEETKVLSNTKVDFREVSVCNMVSKAELLDSKEKLCVFSLLQHSSGVAKLEPKQFAAAVLRIKDFISTTTCLVFHTGRMINVGAVSREHARYACQMYRQFIESVPGVYRSNDGLHRETLEQRTFFKGWKNYNIVSHIHLPYRPDLKLLLQVAGGNANWQPGIFPALKFLIWLRPKTECKCKKEKNKLSCACNVRALIFDTGKIVITGATTIHDVNLAKHRLLSLLDDEEFQDSEEQVPKHLRFAKRREKFLQNPFVVFEGFDQKKSSKKRVRLEQDKTLTDLTIGPTVKKSKDDESVTVFMKACEKGKLENVKLMICERVLQETDENGNTALDRMRKLKIDELSKNHLKILHLLESRTKQ